MRLVFVVFLILVSFSRTTVSTSCEPGFEPQNGGCEMCANGTASSDGLECIPCPVNTYASLSGATDCVACPAKTRTESIGSDLCRSCKVGDMWETTQTTCEDLWERMMPFGHSTHLPRPTSPSEKDAKGAYISGTAIGAVGVGFLFVLILALIIRKKIAKRSSYTQYEAVNNGNVVTVNLADDSNDYEEEEEREVSL